MKKSICFLLSLMMLTLLLPLAQAAPAIDIAIDKEFELAETAEGSVLTLQNKTGAVINVTVDIVDQKTRQLVQSFRLGLFPDDLPTPVPIRIFKPLAKKGNINLYRYTITADNGFKKVLSFAQKYSRVDEYGVVHYSIVHNSELNNNSVSSFGPHFRDVSPEKTKLWYMFTPLDLKIQGRQTYPLIASNMYVIGEVYVDVAGDTVRVSYHNFYDGKGGNTENKREYLNIFNSYEEAVIPNDIPAKSYVDPATKFRFNVPFSIQYDLGGDTDVVMSIRNVVNYWRFPKPENAEFRRFYPNLEENRALRSRMLTMIGR